MHFLQYGQRLAHIKQVPAETRTITDPEAVISTPRGNLVARALNNNTPNLVLNHVL